MTMKIADMTDRHLLNTINYLRRTAEEKRMDEYTACVRSGSMLQGDMATYYNERDQDRLSEMSDMEFLVRSEPRYMVMLREAERRDLPVEELLQEAYLEEPDEPREIPF